MQFQLQWNSNTEAKQKMLAYQHFYIFFMKFSLFSGLIGFVTTPSSVKSTGWLWSESSVNCLLSKSIIPSRFMIFSSLESALRLTHRYCASCSRFISRVKVFEPYLDARNLKCAMMRPLILLRDRISIRYSFLISSLASCSSSPVSRACSKVLENIF